MTFKDSIQTCFRKYADFNGRAGRPEYWWFYLFLLICNLVLSEISAVIGLVFALATLVPSIAAGTRRLHDTGRSGWWQLLWFVPVLGWIVLIVFLAQPGKAGALVDA